MPPATHDTVLLAEVAAGSQDALGVLYDRYGAMVYGISLRIVGDPAIAEEVAQDVFLKVWRSAARFDAERGRPATWLLHMARNAAIDALRSRRAGDTGRTVPLEAGQSVADPGPPVEMQAEVALLGTLVREALMRLSADQRQVLELAYYQGLSHQEIAAHTHAPLGTVKSRLRLAMQNLRSILSTPGRKGVSFHA